MASGPLGWSCVEGTQKNEDILDHAITHHISRWLCNCLNNEIEIFIDVHNKNCPTVPVKDLSNVYI